MQEINRNYDMSYEDLCKLFIRYDYFTLDSFDLILSKLKNYDLGSTNCAFMAVVRRKYEDIKEEFEGINEYDYITRVGNFDISKIIDSVDELNNVEATYLHDVANCSLSNINDENDLMKSHKNEIEELIFVCNKRIAKTEGRPILEGAFSKYELDEFFDNYNVAELKSFKTMLNYCCDYDVENLEASCNKVYQERYDECQKEFGCPIIPTNYSLSSITDKNESLDDKKLFLLYKLSESALSYLASIKDKDDEQENDYIEISKVFNSVDNLVRDKYDIPKANTKKKTR